MHHTYMYQDQGQGSKTQIYASCVHVSGLRIMDKCIIHMCIVVMCIRIDTCIIHACIMIKEVFHLLIIHACIIIKDVLYPRGLKLPEIGKVTSDSQNRLVRSFVRSSVADKICRIIDTCTKHTCMLQDQIQNHRYVHHTHMRHSQGSRNRYMHHICMYQDQVSQIYTSYTNACFRVKDRGTQVYASWIYEHAS